MLRLKQIVTILIINLFFFTIILSPNILAATQFDNISPEEEKVLLTLESFSHAVVESDTKVLQDIFHQEYANAEAKQEFLDQVNRGLYTMYKIHVTELNVQSSIAYATHTTTFKLKDNDQEYTYSETFEFTKNKSTWKISAGTLSSEANIGLLNTLIKALPVLLFAMLAITIHMFFFSGVTHRWLWLLAFIFVPFSMLVYLFLLLLSLSKRQRY